MGSWFSKIPPDPREPSELSVKVNDHFYELYTPKGGPEAVELEIVFFHGLHYGSTSEEAYLTTWTNDNKVLWPKTWLSEDFPQARILSVSYDSSIKQTANSGRHDLYIIAENLMQDIGIADVGQSPGSPVFLVGHCFGGLVIKELCVQASHSVHKNEKMRIFLDNLGGVFFYGTPHQGTNLFSDGKFLSKLLDGPLLEYVGSLNKHAIRLDRNFLDFCHDRDPWPVQMASVGESHETKILGMVDAVIVPEGSARHENYLYTFDVDHISICKPTSKTCNRFKLLSTFIRGIEPKEIHSLRATFSPGGFRSAPESKRKREEEIPREWFFNLEELKYLESDYPPYGSTLRTGAFESLQKFAIDLIVLCSPTLSFGQAPIDFTHRRNPQMAVLILTNHGGLFLPESLVTLSSLKIFSLRAPSLQELPYSVGKLSAFEWFVVRDCHALSALPASFGNLPRLKELRIVECDKLSTLPASFGNLRRLKELSIEGCKLLDNFPENFGNLRALKVLRILKCDVLSSLPPSFGKLRRLKELSIEGCVFSDGHSDNFGNLYALEKLFIGRCDALSTLPASFGNLIVLKELSIEGCKVFDNLSDDFGNLSALEKLSIGRCDALSTLPASFGNLRKLKELRIGSCRVFDSLSDDFGNLSTLEKLGIRYCDALSTLPNSFGNLSTLKELSIEECGVFGDLDDDFGNLSTLEKLDLVGCDALSSLPASFGNLRALKELRIADCKVFDNLSDDVGNLSALKKLTKIGYYHSYSLNTLPASFGNLHSLEGLFILGCPLTTLPNSFGDLGALKKLIIENCDVLGSLSDGFEKLLALEELQIVQCPVLNTRQYNFGNLRALKTSIIKCDVPRSPSVEDVDSSDLDSTDVLSSLSD